MEFEEETTEQQLRDVLEKVLPQLTSCKAKRTSAILSQSRVAIRDNLEALDSHRASLREATCKYIGGFCLCA
jgi:hypothetical protein